MDREWEVRVRLQVFEHLHRLCEDNGRAVPSRQLEEHVVVDGEPIAIMSQQQGIHKPRQLDAALTLKTSASNPYDDGIDYGTSGFIRYHYRDALTASKRARDDARRDNQSVRAAMGNQLPVAYLMGIDKGWYVPFAPANVLADDPAAREFLVDLTELGGLDLAGNESLPDLAAEAPERRYQTREVKHRVHQARFRQMVMRAYQSMCSMCSLKHEELLDAAHIVRDADRGEPQVSNGMALCKIHHAAFDQNFLGIEPGSLTIQVRQDLLTEQDGPMLLHGLQSMQGQSIQLPHRSIDRPSPEALARKWDSFRAA